MRARFLLTRDAKYQELQAGKPFDREAQAIFPEGVYVLPRPTPKDEAVTPEAPKAIAETTEPATTEAAISPIGTTGSTSTDEVIARLRFGWLLRAMGQDENVKTDERVDERKLKRVCNEVLRGVASDRPSPAAEEWTQAASTLAERHGFIWREETKKWEKITP